MPYLDARRLVFLVVVVFLAVLVFVLLVFFLLLTGCGRIGPGFSLFLLPALLDAEEKGAAVLGPTKVAIVDDTGVLGKAVEHRGVELESPGVAFFQVSPRDNHVGRIFVARVRKHSQDGEVV